ncbi:hypothetical protein CR513_29559, partial [Mucuna pruriens]
MRNVRFLDKVKFGGEGNMRSVVFEELVIDNEHVFTHIIVQEANSIIINDVVPNIILEQDKTKIPSQAPPVVQTQQPQEDDIDLNNEDIINFSQWIDAMSDEIKSLTGNDFWDLINLLQGVKLIGIDYKETFSLVSSKDSLRTIITLIVHFDLKVNLVNDCVCQKFNENKFVFPIFGMFILSEESKYIEIILEVYLVLNRFNMKNTKPRDTPVEKGNKFSFKQCPITDL